jgi:hypothetical protein
MLVRVVIAVGFTLTAIVNISQALAACGAGRAPTYKDIQTIWYERTSCFGTCPGYQVAFWSDGDCYYVGYKDVSRLGTYGQTCSSSVFRRAVVVLENDGFYRLDYDSSIMVMDAPHYIVAADRCGVTTKLDWPAFALHYWRDKSALPLRYGVS